MIRQLGDQSLTEISKRIRRIPLMILRKLVGEHRQGFAGNGDGQPGQQGSAPAGRGLAGEPAATEESVPVSRIIGGDTGGVDLYA